MNEREQERWRIFCRKHRNMHGKEQHVRFYYKCYPNEIGIGVEAICPICEKKHFKKRRFIKYKEDITDYECW